MNIRKTLTKDVILPDLVGQDKEHVIDELMDALVDAGKVTHRKAALKAIWERERKVSTGMQKGVALPHAKCDAVDGLVAALGIHRKGVDFQSMDGQPVHYILLMISPANRSGPHIQFLAEISRKLNDDDVRERILLATDKETIIDILSDVGSQDAADSAESEEE